METKKKPILWQDKTRPRFLGLSLSLSPSLMKVLNTLVVGYIIRGELYSAEQTVTTQKATSKRVFLCGRIRERLKDHRGQLMGIYRQR